MGRNISDNSTLVEEMLRGYQQKGIGRRVCICVNLKKTFNSVDWGGIINTLHGMGFARPFIRMLMDCIATPNYSILVEGQPTE